MATESDWEDAPDSGWESAKPRRAPSIYAPKEEWTKYRESGPPVPPPSMAGKPFMAPGQTPMGAAKTTGKALAGVLLEPLATMATGGVSGIAGGVGGAGRTAYGLMKGEDFDTAVSAGADVVRGTQEKFTYQPRTDMGQFTMWALAAPVELASKGLGATGEAAGALVGPRTSAALGTIGATAPEAAGAVLGARGLARGRMQGRAPLTQAQDAVQEAQQAGFKSLPSEAKPGLMGNTLEAAAYRPQLIRDLVRENQTVATNLVKQDLGLPPTARLDEATLGRLRTAAGATYDRVRNAPGPIDVRRTDPNFHAAVRDLDAQFRSMKNVLPELYNQPGLERLRAGLGRLDTVTPGEVVDIVKNLRDTASNTFRNQSASDSALTAARGMRNGADLLEGLLERHLQNLSPANAALYRDFTAARQQIAKLYDAESMSDLVNGVVDPQKARRMMEKDIPLSGNMRTVARAAAAMPNVVRSVEGMGVRAEGGTRMLTSAPARKVATSEIYQSRLRPQGKPMRGAIPMSSVAAGAAALQPERAPFAMSEEEQ